MDRTSGQISRFPSAKGSDISHFWHPFPSAYGSDIPQSISGSSRTVSENCYIIFGLWKCVGSILLYSLVLLTHLYLCGAPRRYKFNSDFNEKSTSMEQNVRKVRSYKKTPLIAVPEIPQYFKLLLPSTPHLPIWFQPFVLLSRFRGSTRKRRHSVLTVWKPRKSWAQNMKKTGEMYNIIG